MTDTEIAVAKFFVSRAQIAHDAHQSWEAFEKDERKINSAAVTETDPAKRAILLRHALDNGLRMAIFERIAQRIRVEIFHTTWPDRADSAGAPDEASVGNRGSGAGNIDRAADAPDEASMGNRGSGARSIDRPADIEEDYKADPHRTVKSWRKGGKYGVVPVFNDDASDASSEVELNEDWMGGEDDKSSS